MIGSIRHKGLRRFYETGDARGIRGDMRRRVAEILTVLDAAENPEEANIPGFRLHPLSGTLQGYWSVRVTGNWRIIFRFEDSMAVDIDLIDYH